MARLTLNPVVGSPILLSSPHIGQFLTASLAGVVMWTQKSTLTALASHLAASMLMLSSPVEAPEGKLLSTSLLFKQLEDKFVPIQEPHSWDRFELLPRINLQREIRYNNNHLSLFLLTYKVPNTPLRLPQHGSLLPTGGASPLPRQKATLAYNFTAEPDKIVIPNSANEIGVVSSFLATTSLSSQLAVEDIVDPWDGLVPSTIITRPALQTAPAPSFYAEPTQIPGISPSAPPPLPPASSLTVEDLSLEEAPKVSTASEIDGVNSSLSPTLLSSASAKRRSEESLNAMDDSSQPPLQNFSETIVRQEEPAKPSLTQINLSTGSAEQYSAPKEIGPELPSMNPTPLVNAPSPAPSRGLLALSKIIQKKISNRSVIAPLPGVISRLLVEPGDIVEKGSPMATLEAMKMKHKLYAPFTGKVIIFYGAGQHVNANALLFRIILLRFSLIPVSNRRPTRERAPVAELDMFGIPTDPAAFFGRRLLQAPTASAEDRATPPVNQPQPENPLPPPNNSISSRTETASDEQASGPSSTNKEPSTALLPGKNVPQDLLDPFLPPSQPPIPPEAPKSGDSNLTTATPSPTQETSTSNPAGTLPLAIGQALPQIAPILEKAINRALQSPDASSYDIAEWKQEAPSLNYRRNKAGFAVDVLGHIISLNSGYFEQLKCTASIKLYITREEYNIFKKSAFFKKAYFCLNEIDIEEDLLTECLEAFVTLKLWKRKDITAFLEDHDPEVQNRLALKKAWGSRTTRAQREAQDQNHSESLALPLHSRRQESYPFEPDL